MIKRDYLSNEQVRLHVFLCDPFHNAACYYQTQSKYFSRLNVKFKDLQAVKINRPHWADEGGFFLLLLPPTVLHTSEEQEQVRTS